MPTEMSGAAPPSCRRRAARLSRRMECRRVGHPEDQRHRASRRLVRFRARHGGRTGAAVRRRHRPLLRGHGHRWPADRQPGDFHRWQSVSRRPSGLDPGWPRHRQPQGPDPQPATQRRFPDRRRPQHSLRQCRYCRAGLAGDHRRPQPDTGRQGPPGQRRPDRRQARHRQGGAGIVVSVGGEGDYTAFARRYLDPANRADPGQTLASQPGKAIKTYERELADWLRAFQATTARPTRRAPTSTRAAAGAAAHLPAPGLLRRADPGRARVQRRGGAAPRQLRARPAEYRLAVPEADAQGARSATRATSPCSAAPASRRCSAVRSTCWRRAAR